MVSNSGPELREFALLNKEHKGLAISQESWVTLQVIL